MRAESFRRGVRVARALLLGALLVPALSGCGLFSDEEILEGERIPLRAPTDDAGGATIRQPPPPPVANADWTQTNGAPSHNSGHLAAPTSLRRAWARDIGAGGGDEAAITSAPIVVGGTVYALDAAATVIAVDGGSGTERWRRSLAVEGERGEDGFGGGLAFDGGRLFAATGFGEVLALDPASGEILWRRRFGAPFRAAPAAERGMVVAVSRDNLAVALAGESGELRWRMQAASADAGILGGASPAISTPLAVLPFTSGELTAVHVGNGRRLWTAVLSGGRRGVAGAAITDVAGDPLIIGPYVVAANHSGRMLAVEARSGERAWTRSIGARRPLWGAGDTIYLVSDDARLMRLSARDGATLWSVQLPAFRKPAKRKGPIEYSGPVLAGGRVLVSDSLGNLIAFDGETGTEVERARLEGGALTGPVVAGGTIYVLSDKGVLHAFR